MIAAPAPASPAFATFCANEQLPRCISAIAPAGKPAKSSASQPLEEVSEGLTSVSTTTTSSVTSPEPAYSITAKSSAV